MYSEIIIMAMICYTFIPGTCLTDTDTTRIYIYISVYGMHAGAIYMEYHHSLLCLCSYFDETNGEMYHLSITCGI